LPQPAASGCIWSISNGAFAGRPENVVGGGGDIGGGAEMPCQLGGGIRDMATDRDAGWSAGVARVILGTAAVENPAILCVPPRAPFPAASPWGWMRATAASRHAAGPRSHRAQEVTELARRFEDAGIAAIIYTDIDRDGAMQGPNVAATAALARAVSVPVIASGGVSSLDDLIALRAAGPIAGAITGRALYDGALDLAAALAALRG
jgi:phosphoribosylformimino-5-aminoimidazole carboxamide ribotide isomerase